MARPRKLRKVCAHPRCAEFGPRGGCTQTVTMTIDEYETIRLIDLEGLTQEQCAEKMEIARTTVQAIYADARKKLAECIVLGRRLMIRGGEIQVCDNPDQPCGHRCCRRAGRGRCWEESGEGP